MTVTGGDGEAASVDATDSLRGASRDDASAGAAAAAAAAAAAGGGAAGASAAGVAAGGAAVAAAAGGGLVLAVLGASQFLMALDSSVMNVSIASVAASLHTTVTGIQTAITLYTLVMATLMITGGKLGAIVGRRRIFALGCVIYACGSLTTALAPNLPVMLVGWSLLEGIGAALIMPAIVALVAGNFVAARRPAAYGLIAAAGAMAIAAGPLIGGAVTTYASWRYVFAAEVVIVAVILVFVRRVHDAPAAGHTHIDLPGVAGSIVGLGMVVFGVLQSSRWGWVQPHAGQPSLFGISPVLWLLLGGGLVLYCFLRWEERLLRQGREPLLDPTIFANRQLRGGLIAFFFQYLIQSGAFFVIPLFLSIVLELSALGTGVRLVPLSIGLLLTAVLVPRLLPRASPRRVVQAGLLALLVGLVLLIAGIDLDAAAGVVLVPLLFAGLGIGALASQLGSVTVSAVPDERSAEVGGLQNTAMFLGSSLGTALIGAVLIGALTAWLASGIANSPDVPQSVKEKASVQLAAGVPFVSDTQLKSDLAKAGVPPDTAATVVDLNRTARIKGLDASLAVVAIIAVLALFFTPLLPSRPAGAAPPGAGT